jgi:hypothetical protein
MCFATDGVLISLIVSFFYETINSFALKIDCLKIVAHFPVQEALKRKLKARMEYAKFLQDTAKEMAKEVQTSRSGETKQTAEDLDEFLNKVSLSELCNLIHVSIHLKTYTRNSFLLFFLG